MSISEYWFCLIGPVQREKLPAECDMPMREAVEMALGKLTGEASQRLCSCWGITPEIAEAVLKTVCDGEAK